MPSLNNNTPQCDVCCCQWNQRKYTQYSELHLVAIDCVEASGGHETEIAVPENCCAIDCHGVHIYHSSRGV